MKRKAVSGAILILLIVNVFTFAFNIQPAKADSSIIIVPDDYPTIQAAIDAATAGDTIIVRAGTYTENVKINKQHLTIKSESGAKVTVVQAANPYDNIFKVTADYTKISGFTVEGDTALHFHLYFPAGIDLHFAGNCIISNNIVLSSPVGISLYSSTNNALSGNIVSNNTDGILLDGNSSNNIISNNTASTNYVGIHLEYASNNKIYLNNFIYNSYNIISPYFSNIWDSSEKLTYTYNDKTHTSYLGNYWSDYAGSDANEDGIGDAPYSIDGDKDNYPLMKPFKNYFAPTPPPENRPPNLQLRPT